MTSAGLLIVAIATILTGIAAHLWDLNDFVYHTYAGYVMVVFTPELATLVICGH